jgi:hypothetical protein
MLDGECCESGEPEAVLDLLEGECFDLLFCLCLFLPMLSK